MSLNFTPAFSLKHPLSSISRFLFCFVLLGLFQRSTAQSLPHPDHIVILIEENQPNFLVIGNSSAAPYINQLGNDSNGVIFTKMYAIEHPSQPNYLDFFAGSNQGVYDDNLPTTYPFTTANLARQLVDKGLSFVTYSQDLPSVGFDGVNSSTGSYVRKHNPVTNWVGNGQNQVSDSLNQPWSAFPTDFSKLPTVAFVVPNEDSDMHNGFGNPTISAGDFWFKEHMKPFIDWVATPGSNTLFIYTFDEDDGLEGNNIPTVFYGPMVKSGKVTTQYNLYNMLRTIEDIYGLGHAGAASTNVPILDCWKTPTGINSINGVNAIKCYPNPASSTLQFNGDALSQPNTEIEITDLTGKRINNITSNTGNSLSVDVSSYAGGMYFYNLMNEGRTVQTGKFIVTH